MAENARKKRKSLDKIRAVGYNGGRILRKERNMVDSVLFFLSVLWYTLGATVICGLAVSVCRRLFVALLGGGVGRGVVIATSIIGTPVHELSHALMCLLFGHRITEMSLWQPTSADGTLGYVTHAYNKKNPYHILGNLFIGIGPVLGGMGVLTLILFLCFPSALNTYLVSADAVVAGGEPSFLQGFTLFFEGLRLFPDMVGEAMTDTEVPVWARILGVIGLISVSLHIELSVADIKGALRSVPLYLVLVLLLTVISTLLGSTAMETVLAALAHFSAYVTALFVIVLVMAAAQILLALPVFLIRKLAGR